MLSDLGFGFNESRTKSGDESRKMPVALDAVEVTGCFRSAAEKIVQDSRPQRKEAVPIQGARRSQTADTFRRRSTERGRQGRMKSFRAVTRGSQH